MEVLVFRARLNLRHPFSRRPGNTDTYTFSPILLLAIPVVNRQIDGDPNNPIRRVKRMTPEQDPRETRLPQATVRLFDDLAQLANAAIGSASGIGREMEGLARERLRGWLAQMEFVDREEFEAIASVAARARAQQESLMALTEDLQRRVTLLEDELALLRPRIKEPEGAGRTPATKAELSQTSRATDAT